MSVNKAILREYKEINLASFSDGQIAIDFPNPNDLCTVQITLLPNDGIYKDGKFLFELVLPADYPNSVPQMRCLTKIFHPNVSYEGRICFNILQDEFNTCLRLVDYAHALLWLLYQPNVYSRLNGDVPQDMNEYKRMARAAIEGGTVARQHFPCALAHPPPPAPVPLVPERAEGQVVAEHRSLRDLLAFFRRFEPPAAAGQPVRRNFRIRRDATVDQPQPGVFARLAQQEPAAEVPPPPPAPMPEQQAAVVDVQAAAAPAVEETPAEERTIAPTPPATEAPVEDAQVEAVAPAPVEQAPAAAPAGNTDHHPINNIRAQRARGPCRRWTIVAPPLRFVGGMRAY